MLNYVEKRVSGVDLLLHAMQYDGCDVAVPGTVDDWGRSWFFAGSKQIFTYAGGGQIFRIKKHRVRYRPDAKDEVMEEIESILCCATEPVVFRCAGALVCVVDGRIEPVDADYLPVILGKVFEFYIIKIGRDGKQEERNCEPPATFFKAFMKMPQSRLPKLKAVGHAPYMVDGGLILCKGYCARSGIYLVEDFRHLKFPKSFGEVEARASYEHIKAHFAGFQFTGEAAVAVVVSAIITAVIRPSLPTVPGLGVSGTERGSGKTELTSGISIIATGAEPSIMPYRSGSDEQAKAMVGLLEAATPMVLCDNVPSGVTYVNDPLCSALTCEVFSDRTLGKNRIAHLPTRSTMFMVNGVNLAIGGDLYRRFLTIEIDIKQAHPEERIFARTFRQICRDQRDDFLVDSLTIAMAYHQVKPKVDCKVLGSFEVWSERIAKPVAWVSGFDVTQERPKRVDDEDTALFLEFLSLWREDNQVCPVTLREACDRGRLLYSWAMQHYSKGGVIDCRSLSKFVRRFAGQVFDNVRIMQTSEYHDHSKLWRLEYI